MNIEELIEKLGAIKGNYNCFDVEEEPYYRACSEAISQLKQLQEIKSYLESSVKDSDKFKRKYDEMTEHTHNYNDVYKAKIFEGMAEAYSDIVERYFKEKE